MLSYRVIYVNAEEFITFTFKLKHCIMAENKKLNRIKVVLAEKDKTGRWFVEKVGKSNCTISKWCNNLFYN